MGAKTRATNCETMRQSKRNDKINTSISEHHNNHMQAVVVFISFHN